MSRYRAVPAPDLLPYEMKMQVHNLAKEMGVPDKELLKWLREIGLPCDDPEDELEEEHISRARVAFSGFCSRDRASSSGARKDMDMAGEWNEGLELNVDELPQTLEELEEFEQSIFKDGFRADKADKKERKADRVQVKAVLGELGVEDKAAKKKVRKLLPEHLARLFNHESLNAEQAELLKKEIPERVVLCCGDKGCHDLLSSRYEGQEIVLSREPSICRLCEGSSIIRGLEGMADACGCAGVRHVLVVGGSPASHNELKNNSPVSIEFRTIQGNVSRSKQRAAEDLGWCDLAVIWAGTILKHEVSNQYGKNNPHHKKPIVIVKRRSVEALCEAVVRFLASGRSKG